MEINRVTGIFLIFSKDKDLQGKLGEFLNDRTAKFREHRQANAASRDRNIKRVYLANVHVSLEFS